MYIVSRLKSRCDNIAIIRDRKSATMRYGVVREIVGGKERREKTSCDFNEVERGGGRRHRRAMTAIDCRRGGTSLRRVRYTTKFRSSSI